MNKSEIQFGTAGFEIRDISRTTRHTNTLLVVWKDFLAEKVLT